MTQWLKINMYISYPHQIDPVNQFHLDQYPPPDPLNWHLVKVSRYHHQNHLAVTELQIFHGDLQ